MSPGHPEIIVEMLNDQPHGTCQVLQSTHAPVAFASHCHMTMLLPSRALVSMSGTIHDNVPETADANHACSRETHDVLDLVCLM
eukprot:6474909-Amphidinium_carterae.3